jgi:hypothetical protein
MPEPSPSREPVGDIVDPALCGGRVVEGDGGGDTVQLPGAGGDDR